MAEIMGHFRNIEQKRRDSYRTDVKKYVPINIPGIMKKNYNFKNLTIKLYLIDFMTDKYIALDDNPPMCDISTANIKEDKLPSFTAEDIHCNDLPISYFSALCFIMVYNINRFFL
jgi:hypothetical protein